ncbi:hypothetical protein [Arenimonas sp.]|jgi:hypothetical protein|uniref:hypothetical protein n=1 Tax=Arenimonas sp. TaxID=1872635 RepID=UPI0037BFC0CC
MQKIVNSNSNKKLPITEKDLEIILSSSMFIGEGLQDIHLDKFLLINRKTNNHIFHSILDNKKKLELEFSTQEIEVIIQSIKKIIDVDELGSIASGEKGYVSNDDGYKLIKHLERLL